MKNWTDISIKRKTNSIILIICFFSLLISSIAFLSIEILSYRDIMINDMMTLADVIGKNSTSAIVFNDAQSATETLKSLKAEQHILYGCIIDKEGQIFALYIKSPEDFNENGLSLEFLINRSLSEPYGHRMNTKQLDLFKEIVLDGERIGSIYIRVGLNELYNRIKKHTFLSGIVLLLVCGVAYIMSARFQKVLTDPLLHLSDIMEKVSIEGLYSFRAQKFNDDELGALISGFNSMLDKIEKRDTLLAESRLKLEERVDERTFELKEANQNLERMIDDLARAKNVAEAASQTKSDFLANMSHELRTPLNHIIGFTELILDSSIGDLNEMQTEYLNDVLQSSKHLLSLINDILDLSKVESGKLELELSSLNLHALLESSMNMVKEVSIKHNLNLSLKVENIPDHVHGDERKIKQILFNLLSNAVKFTPSGGSITLMAKQLNGAGHSQDSEEKGNMGKIKISITDTGIGINEKDLERIFNPFEQVESSTSRKYQGTGLGLSLTRRLVELHGGKIWAESNGKGYGSTMNIVLPV